MSTQCPRNVDIMSTLGRHYVYIVNTFSIPGRLLAALPDGALKKNTSGKALPDAEFKYRRLGVDHSDNKSLRCRFDANSTTIRWIFKIFNGYSVDIQWIFNGYSVDIQWIFSGYSVDIQFDIQWIFSGYSVDIQWIFSGYSVDIHWIFNGYPIDIQWI